MHARVRFLGKRSRQLCALAGITAAIGIGAAWAQDATQGKSDQAKSNPTDGKQVYMQARCFACHGGYGFGGAGPRFRENRLVAIGDYVVGQILIGRGIMPSFADTLNDEQIAAVATYIRNSWGNKFGDVKPEQVAQVRQQVKLNPPDQPHLPPPSIKMQETR